MEQSHIAYKDRLKQLVIDTPRGRALDPNYTPVQAQLPIPYSRTGCLQVLHRITQRYPELVDLPLDHIRKASSSPLQLTAALDKIAHAALDRKYVLIYD